MVPVLRLEPVHYVGRVILLQLQGVAGAGRLGERPVLTYAALAPLRGNARFRYVCSKQTAFRRSNKTLTYLSVWLELLPEGPWVAAWLHP